MKHVAIIGSTGSIGTQTLEIARWNQDIKNLCFISRKKHRLIREAGERVPTGDRWSVG